MLAMRRAAGGSWICSPCPEPPPRHPLPDPPPPAPRAASMWMDTLPRSISAAGFVARTPPGNILQTMGLLSSHCCGCGCTPRPQLVA
uniref:Uncharacterized protein n=1 Tax=Oryza rufipogon TaxID=4529 RepID=A0A0E0PKW2_ORYRU